MATEVSDRFRFLISYTISVLNFVFHSNRSFSAGHFYRVPNGLLRGMWLVDDDTVPAGNRSLVYGARPSVQRRDRGGDALFASQPPSTGVAGADVVVRLEYYRSGCTDREYPDGLQCVSYNQPSITVFSIAHISFSARPCSRTADTVGCTTGRSRHRLRTGPRPAGSSAVSSRSYHC